MKEKGKVVIHTPNGGAQEAEMLKPQKATYANAAQVQIVGNGDPVAGERFVALLMGQFQPGVSWGYKFESEGELRDFIGYLTKMADSIWVTEH